METSSEYTDVTRRSRDDEAYQPNNSEEGCLQEQLTELRLLPRVNIRSPLVSSACSSSNVTDASSFLAGEGDIQSNESEVCKVTAEESSCTAIMAVSRQLETPFDQIHAVENPEQQQSPTAKSLSTQDEGAEGEENEDGGNVKTWQTPSIDVARQPSIFQEMVSERQELEVGESGSDDFEFGEMLEHLSIGELDFLVVTPEDLTAHKLKRIHTALSKAQTLTSTMPYVRTLVSVDMLRLLVQRLGVLPIRDAVTRVLQYASDREESICGMDSTDLLTSNNIATIVLQVRQEMTTKIHTTSPLPPQLARQSSPVKSHAHHSLQSTRSSRLSPALSSPRHGMPRSSAPSSPGHGMPRSPASYRRSILAREGIHVLLQEKIASFDHRGLANGLPAFRVRGTGAIATDSAAKRRQRGLQYANDHVMLRRIPM